MWNQRNVVTDIDAKDRNTRTFEGNGVKDGLPIGLKAQVIRLPHAGFITTTEIQWTRTDVLQGGSQHGEILVFSGRLLRTEDDMQINITERCGRLVGTTTLEIIATDAVREMRLEDRDHSSGNLVNLRISR